MKLRFRGNSLRLRVNQREVSALAAGNSLEERVIFPGDASLRYVLEPARSTGCGVSFQGGLIRVWAPQSDVANWVSGDSVGLYFEVPANGTNLKVAIEKDLECVDGPLAERDPDAFPRASKNC